MVKYSISEYIKTIYSYIFTKLFFSQARLIRRPIYFRGGGKIKGGKGLTTGRFCRFELTSSHETLKIGENCEFGDNTHIVALQSVSIGDNVLIASKVFISDTSHGNCKNLKTSDLDVPPRKRELVMGQVKIGNNVWIGENAVILSGSDIGDGCIIGANSVVSKSIPKYSVVVGANRILRKFVTE